MNAPCQLNRKESSTLTEVNRSCMVSLRLAAERFTSTVDRPGFSGKESTPNSSMSIASKEDKHERANSKLNSLGSTSSVFSSGKRVAKLFFISA
ncbi:hypothetical protein M514_06046 [Trichuris suis]|uniref:Uncharacterized protein n=1 Tax=Trichuris suis TaxID=68888 RepID=A0A085M7D6_9BILA|nr:hypothetical protein M513_06046 [Trichuris suis]KFD70721.1 hypothetical protein M514_06046 [Trichuris suis]